MFDEERSILSYQKQNIRQFLTDLKRVDREQGAILEKQGWKYKETAERTVMFSFGEATFQRRCYVKGGVRKYPADEYLGLERYSRFSKGLLYKLATSVVDLTYRKAAAHFQELLNLNITKDTVSKARKMMTKLYKEREEYRFYEDEELLEKVKVDVLYLEGDGILLATLDPEGEAKKTDFAHFMIHEGIEVEYGKRGKSVHKHEIWSESNKSAREQVMDYLHNHYEISPQTLLVTNSDMGHGYTPYVFEEIAAAFSCKHEHFWDRDHLNKKIYQMMKSFPRSMEEGLFKAIAQHDKKAARTILDTAESLIPEQDEEFSESFSKFSRKLMRDFAYTKSPEMRGLSSAGIGIMESNHTKLSYRMKKQARHWSVEGALTMGQMIIDKLEGSLKDLVFGDWRKEYEKHKNLDHLSVNHFLKKAPKNHSVKQVRQANKTGRRMY